MVVAFADLVGFTQLGTEVPSSELVVVAERLEEMVTDIVEAPVRVAKTLGDGVMLVAPEAAPLVEASLALVEAADNESSVSFPQLHIGLAAGEATTRAGDWFGEPVNLAARISDAARAGSVVVTREVRDMAHVVWCDPHYSVPRVSPAWASTRRLRPMLSSSKSIVATVRLRLAGSST